MFTGIIQALGKLKQSIKQGGDLRLQISATQLDLADVKMGDSISVNGVCLTVVAVDAESFSVDVSIETITRTSLAQLTEGALVNLEKALLPATRLGGHFVSGHVDGLAKVTQIESAARSHNISFKVPPGLIKYIAEKGSVCIDGVSLTVNDVSDDSFSVMIIPHTWESTLFQTYQAGSQVNLEVDLLARYVERVFRK